MTLISDPVDDVPLARSVFRLLVVRVRPQPDGSVLLEHGVPSRHRHAPPLTVLCYGDGSVRAYWYGRFWDNIGRVY